MTEMLPRERVVLALNHKTTDRIPVDFWSVDEVMQKLLCYFHTDNPETVLETLKIDMRMVDPDYIGPKEKTFPDGSYITPMGCHKRRVANEFCVYEDFAGFPLDYAESIRDLEAYPNWPDAHMWDWDNLSDKIGNLHDQYYIRLRTGGLFEQAWALRGNEKFFMDMALNPELAHFIMNKLCDFYCDYVTFAMEAAGDKIDMVYTYDDIASQRSLMMSPDMWAEIIKPYHQKLNAVVKKYGKKVMYHSCGAVRPLIDQLIELPIDVLNPLQPLVAGMDLEAIKSVFGQRVCFHGAMDIQELLPMGSPDDIRKEAKRLVKILGKNGGYILAPAHHIQADTSVENVLALYDMENRVLEDE